MCAGVCMMLVIHLHMHTAIQMDDLIHGEETVIDCHRNMASCCQECVTSPLG